MEIQKIILDETEEEDLCIGLVSMAKQVPDYAFFFKINQINPFCFQRIDDLVIEGFYYRYHFPVFEGYHSETKTQYRFIANKSSESFQKRQITELFSEEQNIKFLLNDFPNADYIIKSSDKFPDFSLLLQPENLVFKFQEILLSSNEELYQTIQYYE